MATTIIDAVRFTPSASANIKMSGGPTFQTRVGQNNGGWSQSNSDWPVALWKFTLQFIRKSAEFDEFIAFWLARRGAAYGFYAQDPKDHSDGGWGKVRLINGLYRLVKEYPDAVRPYTRIITCPRAGTVAFSGVGGSPIVNLATGVVSGATGEGDATFEFDVPVRFTKDQMDYEFRPGGDKGLVEWAQVEMNEVRIKP